MTTTVPVNMHVETAEDRALMHAVERQAQIGGRWSGCRLVAGVATGLLVMAVAVASVSPAAKHRASGGCKGASCMEQSGHFDKVVVMKLNTMHPDDCPDGYVGTSLNIAGSGKMWTFGDLEACASTCENREGCKGFEFHDKNGRCGTYLDGHTLGGVQHYRWLTCLRRAAPAPAPAGIVVDFTIGGMSFDDLMSHEAARDIVDEVVRENIATSAGVPHKDRVLVELAPGSLRVNATVSVDHAEQIAAVESALMARAAVFPADIVGQLMESETVSAVASGPMIVSEPVLQVAAQNKADLAPAPAPGSATGDAAVTSHDGCGAVEFARHGGLGCGPCSECRFCLDGIDGTCGHCGNGYPTVEPSCDQDTSYKTAHTIYSMITMIRQEIKYVVDNVQVEIASVKNNGGGSMPDSVFQELVHSLEKATNAAGKVHKWMDSVNDAYQDFLEGLSEDKWDEVEEEIEDFYMMFEDGAETYLSTCEDRLASAREELKDLRAAALR